MAVFTVGPGGFSTIQAALNAAAATPGADTINVSAGVYNENLSIVAGNQVTLNGANAGTSGTATRSNETNVQGLITVQASGVFIDGLTISTPSGQNAGLDIQGPGAANATIRNSIFNDADGQSTAVQSSAPGLLLSHNKIQGYSIGFYGYNGAAGDVNNNLFMNNATGSILETSQVNFDGNTLSGTQEIDVTTKVGPGYATTSGANVVANSYIYNNVYSRTSASGATNVDIIPQANGISVVGTSTNDELQVPGGISGIVFTGGGGNDLINSSFNDLNGDTFSDIQSGEGIVVNDKGNVSAYIQNGDLLIFSGNMRSTVNLNGASGSVTVNDDAATATSTIIYTAGVTPHPPGGGGGGSSGPSTTPTPGPDYLVGTPGDDAIAALSGDDTVYGQGGNDLILGNQGNDLITVADGANTVFGGMDQDTISAGNGSNLVLGNEGNDVIAVGSGASSVFGGMGNDAITAGNGSNLLYGDEGADTIQAGNGNNTIVGGTGNAAIDSLDGADFITSGSGNDLILGNGGDDTIGAGGGNDTVSGGFGNDVLLGNQGNDIVLGNQGNDVIYGGFGDDTLVGGMGDDTLIGGQANDVLYGDEGANRFVFNPGDTNFVSGLGTGDVVMDFKSGTDSLHFSAGPAGTAQDFGSASVAGGSFAQSQTLAQQLLNSGDTYAFVSNGTDGYLFTSAGNGGGTSIEDVVKLAGVKQMQAGDVV